MANKILIVDDEPTQLKIMETIIARQGYGVETALDGVNALKILKSREGNGIDLMVLDLSMPEMSGIEVLTALRPIRPRLPVVVVTAHSSLKNVVEAMRAGATDFISKPASAERIRTAIEGALKSQELVGELEPVVEVFDDDRELPELLGDSPPMKEALALAHKAAVSSIAVLIEGESGVGKELFARAIQAASSRRQQPMVTVNCGAIPANLVESILFGHEKGAFTGAAEKHTGKFMEADGGTIFLDEIGELPLDTQVKLLRALEIGEIDPVGARVPVKVDARVISATNRNLAGLVAEGAFRSDLYYRLNVFPIGVPALRERRGDIPILVSHFIDRIVTAEKLQPKTITFETLQKLIAYDWPGNVRQLQNALFRAVIMSDGNRLEPKDFPQVLGSQDDDEPGARAAVAGPSVALMDEQGQIRALEEIERDAIQAALDRYQGKMSEVARRLQIGRSTLYRKMEEYGLERPPSNGPKRAQG